MFSFEETREKKFFYNDLYYNFIFDFKRVSKNYFYNYSQSGVFKKRADDIFSSYNSSLRRKVSEILRRNNIRYGCGKKTLENIESLRNGSALVVAGGQQPGLFTGPVFIIYKIVSIIRLSIFLSDLLKIKVLPVFWNASDDSNFMQVNSAAVINKDIKKIYIKERDLGFDGKGKRFSDTYVSRIMLIEKIGELLESIPPAGFSSDIKIFFESCIQHIDENFKSGNPGVTEIINLPDLFSVMIQKIFSRYGLIVFDPSDIGIKELAVQIAGYDIENSHNIYKEILHSGKLLKSAGYHEQLNPEENVLNFFLVESGIRQKIYRVNGSNFRFLNKSVKRDELLNIIGDNPAKISLNVVLRPLFQDTVLPVICTVCGPGEVSYFAQLKGVYKLRGEKSAIIYPRLSATIVENKIFRSLERTGIDLKKLQYSREENASRYLQKFLNLDIGKLLKNFENDVFLKMNGLRDRIEKNGLATGNAFNRIKDNVGKEIEVLNKKIMSELKERNTGFMGDIDRIYLNIFPEGQLQEKIINVFNYINKYGFDLIKGLVDLPDSIINCSHKFIFIGRV